MNNINIKVINSLDPYLFEIGLQQYINSLDNNYDIDIQYRPTSIIYNNTEKINYSALIIMRRKLNEKEQDRT